MDIKVPRKRYSEIAFAIDMIAEAYKTSNPIVIAEKCEEDLDINVTIHQVMDYYDLERMEDMEKAEREQMYHVYY